MKRKIALLGSLAIFAVILAACAAPTPEKIIEKVVETVEVRGPLTGLARLFLVAVALVGQRREVEHSWILHVRLRQMFDRGRVVATGHRDQAEQLVVQPLLEEDPVLLDPLAVGRRLLLGGGAELGQGIR